MMVEEEELLEKMGQGDMEVVALRMWN